MLLLVTINLTGIQHTAGGNHAVAGYLTTSSAASTYVSLSGSYANPAWITSLAWSKITGAPAFLTSYTETDPYRVTGVAVSGTGTKTITITRADSSTVTTTWTDYDTDTNTYVTSASFSGGTLTLTRNDSGTVSVSLDGRYLQSYTETDTLATVTARGSSTTGSITVNGYLTVAAGADLNLRAVSGGTDTGDIVFQDGSGNELHRLWQGSSTLNYRTNAGTTYQLWHSGNLTNLNQLSNGPGYITGITSSMVTTALGYTPQNSSTAITTSNIGSQSVNYAASAGSVAWTNVSGRPTALSSFTNDIVARTTLNASGDFQFAGQDLAQNNFSLSGATTDTDQFGRYYYSGTSGSIWSRYLPVDKTGRYRMRLRWKASATNTTYLAVILLDTSGNNINGAGTYWAYPWSGAGAPTSWTTSEYWYDGSSFPSNAAYVAFGISHTNYGGGSATYYVSQLEIERYNDKIAGNTILHAANYNSYSPTLTGSGASGTWGISITGNAQSSTTTTHLSARTDGSWYNVIWGAGSPSYLYSADSVQIRSSDGALRANIYYDNQNTGYYGDFAATSRMAYITLDQSTSAHNHMVYGGYFTGGDWQTLTNTEGQLNVVQVNNINGGGYSNQAPNVYTYGGILSWRTLNHSFQLYASHTGDITFKTQWNNDNYSGWRRILHESNYNSWAPSLTGGGASGTWSINITGSAGSASSATNATNLYGLGTIQSTSTGTSYTANYQVRENVGGGSNTNEIYAPQLGFHWSGVVASSIMMESSGRIAIRNNPGSGYEAFIASIVYGSESVRAPIFYDSNDTAYYLNPAGGSRLRNLYVGDSGDDWSDPGGWGTQVRFSNGPHVRFVLHARSPGIEAGMYVHTPGSVFMGSYTSHVVSLMYAGNMRMQIEDGRIYSNVYMEAAGSMRAPIFYDSNDTGYYVDPNSNSYLSRLHVADASSGVSMHVGVGSTHGVYTLDNARKYLVVSGDYYPHMALVARYANNTNHGAVFSFVGSEGGAFRQWNLGISNNNPFLFSIGYNRTTDPNPHYGIGDGWSGSDNDHARLSVDRDGNTKIRGMLYVNGTSGGISTGSAVIHAGNIGSQSVNYASSAGNADTVDGYHASAFPYRSSGSSGYYQVADWMQFNTTAGLYWPSYNSAHIYPNTSTSYGSIRIDGSRNSWRGITFDGSVTLMMNDNESGHYKDGYGWQFRWYNGSMYVSTNSYGGGSEYAVIHSGNIGSQSVNYANSAGSLSSMNISQFTNNSGYITSGSNVLGLYSSGFGGGNFTWYQGYQGLQQYAGSWASFLISNHGDGATYYNQTIIMPFWGVPQYMRKEGGTNRGPYTFWTTENLNDYAVNMNQYVRTSDSPTFGNIYSNGWFRNNNNNQGLYSESTTQHWSSKDNGYWDASSTTSVSSIRFWTGGHVSSLRGYVYANTSNEIGFLRTDANWTLRTDNSSNCFAHGTLYSYNDVVAYYSDERLKTKTGSIEDALSKVMSLEAFTYTHNELAVSLGYQDNKEQQIGLSAQDVQKIAPELVTLAAFDVATDEDGNKYSKSGENYLTVKYDRLVPILVEAIKEQQQQIEELKTKLDGLTK